MPCHGYVFSEMLLWVGIYMLLLIFGFLVVGLVFGYFFDYFGVRSFVIGGLLLVVLSFLLLMLLLVDFFYIWFVLILLLNGIGMGLFVVFNLVGVMNSLLFIQCGVGAGMLVMFMNLVSVLSIGVFFSLMIVGLVVDLFYTLQIGFVAYGVPVVDVYCVFFLLLVVMLFVFFFGYNSMVMLLGLYVFGLLLVVQVHVLIGRSFFFSLISSPFHMVLVYAFVFVIIVCLVVVVVFLLCGGKYYYVEGVTVLVIVFIGVEFIEFELVEGRA